MQHKGILNCNMEVGLFATCLFWWTWGENNFKTTFDILVLTVYNKVKEGQKVNNS